MRSIVRGGGFQARTNQFTTLDHGMHYLDAGQYKESQDLLEPSPEGAIARFGTYKTILGNDVSAPAVFEIIGSDGQRIRGGPRTIQLTDFASGKSLLLGEITSAIGRIIPPNRCVYTGAFGTDIDADVLYVWRHNSFSQNVILKEKITLPAEFDPATTRIEVTTEIVEAPNPTIQGSPATDPARADDAFMRFGHMLAVPGLAFPVANELALGLTAGEGRAKDAVHVRKKWHTLDDGRRFVVESVPWSEIEPHLQNLPASKIARATVSPNHQVTRGRTWPTIAKKLPAAPLQVASVTYRPKGYLVDFDVLPAGTVSTQEFAEGTTYYIPTSYTVTTSSSFLRNSVIKFGPNGYLTLSGNLVSPSASLATLTSRDDDTIGDRIIDGGSPPYTSDKIVSSADWASSSLSLFYLNPVPVERFQIRYAAKAIDYYSPYSNSHIVRNCRFEADAIGVYAQYTTLTMQDNKVCNVNQTKGEGVGGSITESGTVTDCKVVNATKMSGHQTEPTIALNPIDRKNMVMFSNKPLLQVAFADALVRSISPDAGLNWTADVFAQSGGPYPQACCDPSATFDPTYGNLFLAYLNYERNAIILLLSIDGGLNFVEAHRWEGLPDQPTVVTGPGAGPGTTTVWVSWMDNGHVRVAGASVSGLGLGSIGAWPAEPSSFTSPLDAGVLAPDIAVGPDGHVLCTFQTSRLSGAEKLYLAYDDDGLGPHDFGPVTLIGWVNLPPFPAGSIRAQPNIGFNAEPGIAWDHSGGPYHGRQYLLWTKRDNLSTEDTDVYVFYSSNQFTDHSEPVRVYNHATGNDKTQFLPRLALDQKTGYLAVGWYDCREDAALNTKSQFYIAVSKDGGQTFSPILVQPAQSDASAAGPSNRNDRGDYTSLDFWGGLLGVIWVDNSGSTLKPDGNPDNPDLPTFDIYTSIVRY